MTLFIAIVVFALTNGVIFYFVSKSQMLRSGKHNWSIGILVSLIGFCLIPFIPESMNGTDLKSRLAFFMPLTFIVAGARIIAMNYSKVEK
jgi:hypothetical protein